MSCEDSAKSQIPLSKTNSPQVRAAESIILINSLWMFQSITIDRWNILECWMEHTKKTLWIRMATIMCNHVYTECSAICWIISLLLYRVATNNRPANELLCYIARALPICTRSQIQIKHFFNGRFTVCACVISSK